MAQVLELIWQLPLIEDTEVLILEQWPERANAPPVLTASVSVEAPRTVRVRAHATDDDGVLSYQWFFGDLTFATGPEHRHTYCQPGTYELIAYAADTTGNTSCRLMHVVIP